MPSPPVPEIHKVEVRFCSEWEMNMSVIHCVRDAFISTVYPIPGRSDDDMDEFLGSISHKEIQNG
jgi:hypothetical protein